MKRIVALVLGTMLAFLDAAAAGAAQPLTLKLLTTSSQITPGSANQSVADVTVLVSGGKKATLSAHVIDLVLDKTGKSPVPAGSTKYTLAKQVHFEPQSFDYIPSTAPQRFTFKVSASNNNLAELRYGGIQSVLSSKPNKGGSSSEIGAITTFAIVPKGLSLSIGSGKIRAPKISEFRIVQKSKDSLADWIFPDIPGIINRAPVTLKVKISNNNDLPVFTSQQVIWSNKSEPLQVVNLPQRLLFGNQAISISQDSTTHVQNSPVPKNFAKTLGLLNVTIAFSTFLGGQRLKPVTRELSVLIFPWKELVFWALIMALVVWRVLRNRRSDGSRIEPNIVWLFLVWIFKILVGRLKSLKRS